MKGGGERSALITRGDRDAKEDDIVEPCKKKEKTFEQRLTFPRLQKIRTRQQKRNKGKEGKSTGELELTMRGRKDETSRLTRVVLLIQQHPQSILHPLGHLRVPNVVLSYPEVESGEVVVGRKGGDVRSEVFVLEIPAGASEEAEVSWKSLTEERRKPSSHDGLEVESLEVWEGLGVGMSAA